MHFAAKSSADASEVIRELHARGLSVSAKAKGRWIESVQCGDGMQPLHLVEHPGTARALVELGADPDAFGVSGWGQDYGTCVFMAAANGKAETLKVMLPACSYISGSWCWVRRARRGRPRRAHARTHTRACASANVSP